MHSHQGMCDVPKADLLRQAAAPSNSGSCCAPAQYFLLHTVSSVGDCPVNGHRGGHLQGRQAHKGEGGAGW